ncbi:uncharacterized protein LOC144709415 [Wolffia australiana]
MGRVASFFLLASLILSVVAISIAQPKETEEEMRDLLLRRPPNNGGRMTCERFPRLCLAFGSPGRDCCQRHCVNLKNDMFNCGRCGNWCRYGQACCGGKCVNTLFSSSHCGACNRRCRKPSKCLYGMCNYA